MLLRSFVMLLLAIAYGPLCAAAEKRPPTAVMAKTAQKETVTDRIEALGTLKANEAVDITVHAADFVTQIHFTEGQKVTQGDLLLTQESNEEQAQLREADYTLQESLSQLERIRAIAKRGDASQSLLDERQREYNVAKSRLAAIESRIKDRKVHAPFSGTLGLRNVSPGAYMNPGEVVTTLIDDSVMKLDFDIPAIYLSEITPGTTIEATTPAFPDRSFQGTITTLNNQVDPVSRSITARAALPNTEGLLKPGMLMEVNLLTRQRQAIVVPEEAIIPEAANFFVYVLEQQQDRTVAKRREITIGSRWEGKVEVLSGLTAQDRIVTDGTNKLRPNSSVRIIDSVTKNATGAQ